MIYRNCKSSYTTALNRYIRPDGLADVVIGDSSIMLEFKISSHTEKWVGEYDLGEGKYFLHKESQVLNSSAILNFKHTSSGGLLEGSYKDGEDSGTWIIYLSSDKLVGG